MTELKCPYCNKPLVDRGYYDYMCPDECDGAGNIVGNESMWQELITTRKALDYCVQMFRNLESVLDEKADARDFDDPDLYAWAVRIKPIWQELREITGVDYRQDKQ